MSLPNSSNPSLEVANLMGLVDTYIRWREATGEDRGYEIYHPSSFGKCLRMMQYQRYEARGWIKGEKEQFESKKLRLFENGHWMHDRWRNYFTELGVLKGVWQCRNPLCMLFDAPGHMEVKNEGCIDDTKMIHEMLINSKYSPSRHFGLNQLQGVLKPDMCICGCNKFQYHEVLVKDEDLNFRGHCDAILDFSKFDPSRFDDKSLVGFRKIFNNKDLPKGNVVLDFKTINAIAFSKLRNIGPSLEYRIQLTIYANILDCDYGILIYEDKDKFDTAAFKIERNTESIFKEVKKQALKMQDFVETRQLPPPRHSSKSSYGCINCPFSKPCHSKEIWDDPDLLEMKQKDFYGNLLSN